MDFLDRLSIDLSRPAASRCLRAIARHWLPKTGAFSRRARPTFFATSRSNKLGTLLHLPPSCQCQRRPPRCSDVRAGRGQALSLFEVREATSIAAGMAQGRKGTGRALAQCTSATTRTEMSVSRAHSQNVSTKPDFCDIWVLGSSARPGVEFRLDRRQQVINFWT